MTYGVDQCRVCGVKIEVRTPRDMEEWIEAQRHPIMPEKEWRRRGWLAAPTRMQKRMPAYGCCPKCGLREMNRKMKAGQRLLMAGAVAGVALTIVWMVITFAPYNGIGRAFAPPPPAVH